MTNKTTTKFKFYSSLLFLFVFFFSLLLTATKTFATGNTYYISPSGNDETNTGNSPTSPFATLDKAESVLQAGDTLKVMPGTFEISGGFDFNPIGTAQQPIIIEASDTNQRPVIDFTFSVTNPKIIGKYVHFKNIDFTKGGYFCTSILGENITFSNVKAYECKGGGININGQHIIVEDSEVFRTNLNNEDRQAPSWNSGLKVGRGAEDVILRRNKVYHNYSEGLAVSKGINIQILDNIVYDNFHNSLYVDNSYDVIIDGNLVYCTDNDTYDKLDGTEATGLSLGEEYYDGWGAQMKRIKVTNNIVSSCGKGFTYFSQVDGGGMEDIIVANNTFWNADSRSISIMNDVYKSKNTYITNNIFGTSSGEWGYIDDRTGIEFSHNLWVEGEPSRYKNVSGPGDVYGDPLFVTTPVIDNPETFKLSANSPTIGAAAVINDYTLTKDFFDIDRQQPDDIGAVIYNNSELPDTCIDADIDRSGTVNIVDYTILINDFFSSSPINPRSDINTDGRVDIMDYSILASKFLQTGECLPY